ncbi:proline-specific permease, putative [Talaromyces stipitatus ATCC 10500]|uniref:Proline-specific permease, putative n=1 Tax=Talaromyces stipitatus (strain ATCC 10500 / CBS 375.48 / QM 6759 / NRRL 1006) TaxID=441959 RepID=B8M3X7_TALSN|nr:proline-specific permease, putative [Talaromyces stipitatus ATCC 10500]EED20720.1 proline-specific permease, putative [Talaromyces stipitatus ATCC 10500]
MSQSDDYPTWFSELDWTHGWFQPNPPRPHENKDTSTEIKQETKPLFQPQSPLLYHTQSQSHSHSQSDQIFEDDTAGTGTIEWIQQPPIIVPVRPSSDRITKRRLRGIHLFMITINGTLGTGLYWRGGQILELGGPLAVLLSFLLVGLLAWAVMQCITEMLCIWPIPGALSVYVSEFVDSELGIAVGVTYWFTYSVSFSALVATSAAELVFWPVINDSKSFQGLVIYFAIPVALILVNALSIGIYRHVELYTGILKICFLIVIFVFLIVLKFMDWSLVLVFDHNAAPNWATAFIMSISIATFAYVGVEIVAASALEVKWPRRIKSDLSSHPSQRSNDTLIGNTVKFSAIWISVMATLAYTLTSVLATLEIPWDDCQLPRLSWVTTTTPCSAPSPADIPPNNTGTGEKTSSVFVAIASRSSIPHLGDIFNLFLVFTCLSCASTNLYVASRALFGLTSRLDDGRDQPWYLRAMAYFGKTDQYSVPRRAMILSAFAFWWVPFLQLRSGTGTDNPIGMFVEILAEMASVGILIVWACECLAFIRYYHCISTHRETLEREGISQVRRWSHKHPTDYPYRGSGQPFLAYAALAGCMFVLVVANSAALWDGFHVMPFLSSYLIVIVFIALLVAIKLKRGGKWAFVDLSNEQKVIRKINNLHSIRLGAT